MNVETKKRLMLLAPYIFCDLQLICDDNNILVGHYDAHAKEKYASATLTPSLFAAIASPLGVMIDGSPGSEIRNLKPVFRPIDTLDIEQDINGQKVTPLIELFKSAYFNIFGYYPEDLGEHDYDIVPAGNGEQVGLVVFDREKKNRYGFTFAWEYKQNATNHKTHWREFHLTHAFLSASPMQAGFMKLDNVALYNRLYKWHFDVLGAIDNGEAYNHFELLKNLRNG